MTRPACCCRQFRQQHSALARHDPWPTLETLGRRSRPRADGNLGRVLAMPRSVRRTLELSCEAPLCLASSASTPCSTARHVSVRPSEQQPPRLIAATPPLASSPARAGAQRMLPPLLACKGRDALLARRDPCPTPLRQSASPSPARISLHEATA